MSKKPTVLMILDGYGLNDNCEANAVCEAKTPIMDQLKSQCPFVKGNASGMAVGLPEGQMGNSEVGHLNMGAGRIVYQELTRITKEIEDGDFFQNEALLKAVRNAKENNSALHLFGLLSDGGVHSHNTHVYGILELAKREGLSKVFVHCFLDGRDTPTTAGKEYIKELNDKMKELGVGQVASVMGRYYAMDRDNRWERVEKAYDAIALGKGNAADSAVEAMELSYKEDVNDEFVIPTVIKPEVDKRIQANDTIIFFNFRPDRARELSRTFIEPDFAEFNRERGYIPVHYISMTQYDASFEGVEIAFKPETVTNTLGEYLSANGVPQLRIAETEKYAHVTYFFNGGLEKQYEGEDRILVPSPKVATYDLQPEMSAYEVTEKVLEAIDSDKYKVIILNYANTDMVGHTGVMEAAEKAVMTVDECSKKVIDAILAKGGNVILTADHGNAEKMIDYDTKKPWTAHTTNPVECVIAGAGKIELRDDGRLADISPTILDLLDMDVPAEMTGTSLIKK